MEDDPKMMETIVSTLNNGGFITESAVNGEEAIKILKDFLPDLIISDVMMPVMHGIDFRKLLLNKKDLKHIPFIFLTVKSDVLDKVKGLNLDVDDYMTKPFEPVELIARIQAILKRYEYYATLIDLDPLTNLYNKHFIEKKLDHELKRIRRYKKSIATLLFIDIDDFKNVNDTHGHYFGDKVLQSVGKTILSNVRDVDFAGRWGGDEFLIIMPETPKENAIMVSSRIANVLNDMKVEDKSVKLKFSGGIASCPQDGTNIKKLLVQADKALYQAKADGKNKILHA